MIIGKNLSFTYRPTYIQTLHREERGMELKLKDGWWDYFLSGFFVEFLICFLIIIFAFPEILSLLPYQSIFIIFTLLIMSVAYFIKGCKVKKS